MPPSACGPIFMDKEESQKTLAARLLAGRRWSGVSAKERSRLMRKAAEARMHVLTPKERRSMAQNASRCFWDNLTPEQRSAEMKRRAKVRNQNRARKAKS